MEILIISDTHGRISLAEKAIEQFKNNIDMIIHCGDVVIDVKKIKEKYNIPIEYVKGNCDFDLETPSERFIEVEGKRIMITHGHNYGVKYTKTNLYYAAQEKNVDAVIFGHTHIAEVEEAYGILFINPGSISLPRNGVNSYAILSVSEGKMFASIHKIK